MTFDQMKTRVGQGVLRDDLSASYGDFINEAIMEIERRRSWQCMYDRREFIILNGASSTSLLTDANSDTVRFKELTRETSAISVQHTDTNGMLWVPCDIWSREKLIRRQSRLISNSILFAIYMYPNTIRRTNVPVYLEWIGGNPTLNTLYPVQDSQMTFSVQFYGFLPDLSSGSDHNTFTDNYPEMVIAKAKSIAFEAINDPAAEGFEQLFENRFRYAAAQDAYQALAGRDMRM